MEAISEPCATSSSREEFLHTKINNKDAHVDYGATKDMQEDACSLRRQYGRVFDSIELK